MDFHKRPKKTFFYTICFCFFFYFRDITVVCLDCDFLADFSGLDKMAVHLSQQETHTCQVVVEKGMYIDNCVTLDF